MRKSKKIPKSDPEVEPEIKIGHESGAKESLKARILGEDACHPPAAGLLEDERFEEELNEDADDGRSPQAGGPLNAFRLKQLRAVIMQYISGLRLVIRHRKLSTDEDFEKYGDGMSLLADSAISIGEILLRKWVGEVPYIEEITGGAVGVTVYVANEYIDRKIRTRGSGGPTGERKDNPPQPSGRVDQPVH